MKIVSHRGYWLDPKEQNTIDAFNRSFELGVGIETDIRDANGILVVSHDMPTSSSPRLESMLSLLKLHPSAKELTIALNVKADGLSELLATCLREVSATQVFAFDMSVPDMRGYFKCEIPVFARLSEVETQAAWFDKCDGIWLDAFDGDWYSNDLIDNLLNANKRVCVVSPELHGRSHKNLWSQLGELRNSNNLLLCTDFPEQGLKFFQV